MLVIIGRTSSELGRDGHSRKRKLTNFYSSRTLGGGWQSPRFCSPTASHDHLHHQDYLETCSAQTAGFLPSISDSIGLG